MLNVYCLYINSTFIYILTKPYIYAYVKLSKYAHNFKFIIIKGEIRILIFTKNTYIT